jgi:hypothetical protein
VSKPVTRLTVRHLAATSSVTTDATRTTHQRTVEAVQPATLLKHTRGWVLLLLLLLLGRHWLLLLLL